MNWIVAVIVGHSLNAVSFVLDKVLLTKSISNPFAFTFYIGVLGLLSLVLIPFGFDVPTTASILLNLVAGAAFTGALLFFFLALKGLEASRISTFIGGAVPVLTLVFELIFLDTIFSSVQLWAFAILVLGTIVITIDLDHKEQKGEKQGAKAWVYGFISALLFAIAFGMTAIAFETQEFFSAFIWMRMGSFLFPLTFLFFKGPRAAIVDSTKIFKEKAGILYLVAQGVGAAGFIFINYAISIASVSIVNAMQGVQYAILLIMVVIGTVKYPQLLKENIGKKSIGIKILAVVIIGAGLALIALYGS